MFDSIISQQLFTKKPTFSRCWQVHIDNVDAGSHVHGSRKPEKVKATISTFPASATSTEKDEGSLQRKIA